MTTTHTTEAARHLALREYCTTGRALQLRKAARMPIAVVARSVGVDQSTVGRWERAERVPVSGGAAFAYLELLRSLERAQR